jgi:hypothetical protein
MSLGSSVEGDDVDKDSVKFDARIRNTAVWVRAESGARCWFCEMDAKKLAIHEGETGRDLEVNR